MYDDKIITDIGQRPTCNQLPNQLICGTITEYLNSEFNKRGKFINLHFDYYQSINIILCKDDYKLMPSLIYNVI